MSTPAAIAVPGSAPDQAALRDHLLRMGVWMFLATVTMLFAALSSAYVVRGASPDWAPIRLPGIVWANTLVIIASSGALAASRRALRKGHARDTGFFLAVTLLLGLAFLAGQIGAWRQLAASGIGLPTSPHSSFFFMLTGLHGVHLTAGLGLLSAAGVCLAASRQRRPVNAEAVAVAARRLVELGSLFWHFLAALWVYLVVMLTFFA